MKACLSLISRLCLIAIALCFCQPAAAQFAAGLRLDKTNYLALEQVTATVTVSNRSGADVVMSGSSQGNWLAFEVTDGTGRTLTPIAMPQEKTFLFKAGTTIEEKVVLSERYALGELGTYGVTATVYHPPTRQFYASNRTRLNVLDAKPFWETQIGVPAGYRNAGRIHRYSLSIFRDVDRTSIYVRVTDERSGEKLVAYPLGPVSSAIDPQANVDNENKLHVMFLAVPRTYCHAVILPDGKLAKREYHKELDNSRPVLIANQDGTFAVQGGELYDPSAPPPPKPKVRGASERPPGL